MKLILYCIFVSFVSLDDHIVAHPGARTWCHAFAVVGVALLAILTDHSSLKTKKYFDYDYKIPPMESDHRKGCAGRGMGY